MWSKYTADRYMTVVYGHFPGQRDYQNVSDDFCFSSKPRNNNNRVKRPLNPG